MHQDWSLKNAFSLHKDSSVDVRRVALRTLAHLAAPGDAMAMESAAQLLTDRAWPVRWAAVDAVVWLAQGGSRDTVSRAFHVISMRLEDVDWPVRMAAAIGLRNFIDFLSAVSREMDPDELESQQVAGLEAVQPRLSSVVHPLLKLLRDPKEAKVAALELLPLVSHRAEQDLAPWIDGLDPEMARAAQEAIAQSAELKTSDIFGATWWVKSNLRGPGSKGVARNIEMNSML